MKTPVTNEAGPTNTESPFAPRLRDLRTRMRERGLDAVLVRATDRYLNEYVPTSRSTRAFLTGFRGSMGDALVTHEQGLLFIDGRYTLQAATEAPDFEAVQVALGQPIEEGWIASLSQLAEKGVRTLGVETDRVPVATYEQLHERATSLGITLVPTIPSLVEELRATIEGGESTSTTKTWPVDASLSGRSVEERLESIRPALAREGLDGFVVIPLDEIAWLTNLRGDAFPHQATFPARALALTDEVLLAADEAKLTTAGEATLRFVPEDDFETAVAALVESRGSLRLGYSPAHTPAAVVESLKAAGAQLSEGESPFSTLRTHKTPAELLHMAHAFARADEVVQRAQRFVHHEVTEGRRVTEAEVARQVKALFLESGAWGLSFQVIAAAGAHGAVIHYSNPDDVTPLQEGEMFLLDTGGYYEGGYATDLTRTFLVGGSHIAATSEQKRLFTLVLKGAIAGMSARFPRGTRGEQLDALVRAPLWAAGLNYAHGTGHGVGVNVHEFPPRLMPGNRHPIEPGHVFSVEPGVYLPGYGGVRIENLVTCVDDPEDAGFLRIRPLTFSPFDERLFDDALLTNHERAFLSWFADGAKRSYEERLSMPLPPLPH